MLKKIIAVALVVTIMCTTGTIGYTARSNNRVNEIEILRPEEDRTATSESVVLVSGRAREGANVVLEVYSVPGIISRSYSLRDIPADKDLVLIGQERLRVGSLGTFAKEVELRLGLNKINIYLDTNSNNVITRYIYVTEISQAKRALDSFNDIRFSDTIRQLIRK